MAGPFSIQEIEKAIHASVVESKSRQREVFPLKLVLIELQNNGFSHDDIEKGVESLRAKGLITADNKISDDFFDKLGSIS